MECPGCKAEIPQDSRFCTQCGATLPVVCPSCGSANPPRANFCATCGERLGASCSPSAAAPTPPHPPAERRQLTIMFCDLVGSTALSARLDPEELGEVIAAYRGCVANTVRRFEGFTAKYMGDGVLVYFGYPQAHEDDAERAVRAGLQLVSAVRALKAHPDTELQVRVGVATGLVVVGDLVGSGEAQERGVVGETPNLAARLQALADPSAVVIAAGTRRLLGGLFDHEELGPVEVKGYPEPVHAWRVRGESAIASRFEALRNAAALTPFVGREEEIGLLLRCWRQARGGSGQVVLLSAEPGVGKSRLAAALRERLLGERHAELRYFCSPHHRDSALFPVIGQLERMASFGHDDAPEAKVAKLVALLDDASAEDRRLLAELLSLPADRVPAVTLEPAAKRERTLAAVLRHLERLARQAPVLMVLEDAHWIDPSSLAFLHLAVDRVAGLPVLLLVTFRPEFEAHWVERPRATLLALGRLSRRDTAALVRNVSGERPLPGAVVDEIIARTDGVPLFVEELTKAILEAGADRREANAAAAPATPTIPATLHASLMVRLDRLRPAARETAQAVAALGREFPWGIVRAISALAEEELRSSLEELVGSGLVLCRGEPPAAIYTFKHALVQDAAYASMLKRRRERLHTRIAAVLEQRFAALVENAPEVLGHHHAEAGNSAAAIRKFLEAGTRASARSSNLEAVAHFARALGLLGQSPAMPDRDALELRVRTGLSAARMASDGYAAPETVAAFAAARELAARIGDRGAQFRALFGLYTNHYIRAQHARALSCTEQALRLAHEDGSEVLRCVAHRMQAAVLNATGSFVEARTHAAAALALYDRETHVPYAVEYGHDLGVAALAHVAVATWHLGCLDQAADATRRAPDLAAAVQHANTATYCHFFPAGLVAASARGVSALDRASRKLAELSQQHGLAQWAALGTVLRGCCLAFGGGPAAEAVGGIEAGLQACREIGFELYRPMFLGHLAEAQLRAGNAEGAARTASQALSLVDATGERADEPELLRLMACVLAARSPAEGEAHFRRAMELASRLNARTLELRAAVSLARLWREHGKGDKALDLLAPIHGWFTEGFGTPDLKEAKALLDELRRP
jgi:predicted ATPase/class 3 adenylate cyclase